MRPVGVFVVMAEKGEFILSGFNFRGCLTRIAASVFVTGAEAVEAFMLLREVRLCDFTGIELRAMLFKS